MRSMLRAFCRRIVHWTSQQRFVDHDHKHWLEWARRLPRSAFILWLGGHIADELMTNKPRRTSLDDLADAVIENRSGSIQSEAECFIRRFYFSYQIDDPQLQRNIMVFRKVVRRKLLHYKQVI